MLKYNYCCDTWFNGVASGSSYFRLDVSNPRLFQRITPSYNNSKQPKSMLCQNVNFYNGWNNNCQGTRQ